MKNLICAGCSWTYGVELPGDEPYKKAWPAHLGKLLDMPVINLGENSCSNEQIVNNFLLYASQNKIESGSIAIMATTQFNRKMGWRTNTQNKFIERERSPHELINMHKYWISLHTSDGKHPEVLPAWEAYVREEHCETEMISRNLMHVAQFQLACKALGIEHYVKPAWCHPPKLMKGLIQQEILNIDNLIDWERIGTYPLINYIVNEVGEEKVWEDEIFDAIGVHREFDLSKYMHELGHPTEEGHKLIAEKLYKWIKE